MVNNMIKKLTGTVSCDSALSRRAGQESLDLDLTVLRCRHPPPGRSQRSAAGEFGRAVLHSEWNSWTGKEKQSSLLFES